MAAKRPNAVASIKRLLNAMSIAIRTSIAVHRRDRSRNVRLRFVVRSPRIVTVSPGGIVQRRTLSPDRERIPECGGTSISTGSVGLKSSPAIQAAVAPAKTVSAGSNRCHARNTSHGSSGRPFQQ
jgi:hypothetical protein